jgi:hypothetical protein
MDVKSLVAAASRFQFQGPVLTLTLKDPSSTSSSLSTPIRNYSPKPAASSSSSSSSSSSVTSSDSNPDDSDTEQEEDGTKVIPKTHARWWNQMHHSWAKRKSSSLHSQLPSSAIANILNLDSLAPTILCSLRTIQTPLPNYLPALKAASLTAAYNYHELKTKPSVIETDISFYSKTLQLDLDVASTYNPRDQHQDMVIRLGRGNYQDAIDNSASTSTGTSSTSASVSSKGFYGLVRFVRNKGRQMLLQHASGQYRFNLPFQTIGSVSITPSYDFYQQKPACSIVGKSGSGRTATLLDLNWDRPTLSVIHALDEKNTIQPEISLYDAKILYNWSLKLTDGSGMIKTRVDPTSAVQVTWIDQSRNGKWVTDFRLPLVGMGGGPLMGDIRVRRQFVF